MAIISCPECGGKVSDVASTCIHCGYPLKEGHQETPASKSEKTCPECGRAVSEKDSTCPECGAKLKKALNRKGLIGIFVGVVAAACILAVILFFGNLNPVAKYIKNIESSNYDSALTVYNSKILGNSELESELESTIRQLADETYEKYLKEELSEEQAKNEIKNYSESVLGGNYAKLVSKKIDGLATSRANYIQACEEESNNNLQEAYKHFAKIAREDPNYEAAQAKVKELAGQIKASYISEAEEFIKSKKYDEAIQKIDDASALLGNDVELNKLKAEYDEKKYERDDVDLRNAKWGDSIETVKRYEKCEILEDNGSTLFVSDSLDGMDVWVIYYFNEDDQLFGILYSIEEYYTNYDLYLSAYENLANKLTEKYGTPDKVNNRRSSMANYCSTEGMALQLGYIAKERVWNLDNMEIDYTISCPNELYFLISYTSTEIKATAENDNL